MINQDASELHEADEFSSQNIRPYYLNEIIRLEKEYKTWNGS